MSSLRFIIRGTDRRKMIRRVESDSVYKIFERRTYSGGRRLGGERRTTLVIVKSYTNNKGELK